MNNWKQFGIAMGVLATFAVIIIIISLVNENNRLRQQQIQPPAQVTITPDDGHLTSVPVQQPQASYPAAPTSTSTDPELKRKTGFQYLSTRLTCSVSHSTFHDIGGLSGIQIAVSNAGVYNLEDVMIDVYYFSKKGELLTTKTISSGEVPLQTVSTINAPDFGRGATVQCKIVGIKSVALGI